MRREPLKPSDEEKVAAQRAQLREQERIEAHRIRKELERTKRLPERDRARVVRNLGGMVETMWRDRPSEGARELFRRAYGDSEPNLMKKRQRYMRFESEPLPEEQLGPGEYCATGATFAKLADAYADLAEDSSNDDAKLRAVMRLVEGTSLDRRGHARGIRENEDARRALVNGFAKFRDEILREVNLGLVFSKFTQYPLQAFYSVPDLLRSVHDSGNLRVLEPDLRKAGLELAELKGLPPGALEERTAGLHLPHKWRFMRAIEPAKLAIDNDAERLVPGELVARMSTDDPHWVVPRIRIGAAYFPGRAPLIDLDLDRHSLDGLDPGTLDRVIEAARDAALRRPGGAQEECLTWCAFPLHLGLVPLGAPDNIEVCLWATMSDNEYFATVQPTRGQGQWFDAPCDYDLFLRGERVFLLDGDDLSESFSTIQSKYTYTLMTISSEEGVDFLLGAGVRIKTDKLLIDASDVEEGRCTGLVEIGFDDPSDNYTPLPHDSLGAAILRNLLHAAPERRLQRLLAAEARRYVGPTARFLAVERERFEAALRGGAAAGGG